MYNHVVVTIVSKLWILHVKYLDIIRKVQIVDAFIIEELSKKKRYKRLEFIVNNYLLLYNYSILYIVL